MVKLNQKKSNEKSKKLISKTSDLLSQAADELDYVLTLSSEKINKFRKERAASFKRLRILLDLFFKEDPKTAQNELKEATTKWPFL